MNAYRRLLSHPASNPGFLTSLIESIITSSPHATTNLRQGAAQQLTQLSSFSSSSAATVRSLSLMYPCKMECVIYFSIPSSLFHKKDPRSPLTSSFLSYSRPALPLYTARVFSNVFPWSCHPHLNGNSTTLLGKKH